MYLDRFCIFSFILSLPILFLPNQYLIFGEILGGIIFLLNLYRKNILYCLLGVILIFNYNKIINIFDNANNIQQTNIKEKIEIVKILKQGEYQTAIARSNNKGNIYITWQNNTPLLLNAVYDATLNIKPISARSNMGNYQKQRWYFSNRINSLANVKKANLIEKKALSLRNQWLLRVKSQIENLNNRGILIALAFGERVWIDSTTWDTFQKTTTAHLIAISGLHISLSMGLGFWLSKIVYWLLLRYHVLNRTNITVHYIMGSICAICYSFLAGFTYPTFRALLAILIILICHQWRKYYTPFQLWWIIVALITIIDPLSLLSDSFWLSILAVMSLIIWYKYIKYKNLKEKLGNKKLPNIIVFFLSLINLQIALFIMFLPVQFYFFEGFSPLGVIANLIIVPLYSFLVIPIILFSLVTDNLFHSWYIADLLVQFGLDIISFIKDKWFYLNYQQFYKLILFNITIVLIIYGIINFKNKLYWIVTLLFGFLFYQSDVIYHFINPKEPPKWVVFDVGQGLAMGFIYHKNDKKHAIFFDTGGSWKNNSMANLEIIPYLRKNNIYLESIILSHDDNDHAGGVSDLLKYNPNATLISSSQKNYNEIYREKCTANHFWQYGDFKFTAHYPEKIVPQAKNNHSCILLVEIGPFFKGILTGDITMEQEKEIINKLKKADILQVAHHGSKTSSSYRFLQKTQPKISIISAGRWNIWRHPSTEVIKRLRKYSEYIFNTAESGMIVIQFYPNYWEINTARNQFTPWYNQLIGSPKKGDIITELPLRFYY